jgi:mannose-6-phosphate isomerase-like protein (cupin superfamily)
MAEPLAIRLVPALHLVPGGDHLHEDEPATDESRTRRRQVTIKDTISEEIQGQDMHQGQGKFVGCFLFRGDIDTSMALPWMRFEPGAFAGYHRHERHDSILYVVSGTGEHCQDGEMCRLEPGDAVLIKAGCPHALKNIGNEGLEVLEFVAQPGDQNPFDSVGEVPMPEAMAAW